MATLEIIMRIFVLSALVLVAACVSPGPPPPSLASSNWMLDAIAGGDANATPRRPTLEFGVERANGSAGCNAWSAPYRQTGADLRFGGVLSTRIACSFGMEGEQAYIAALGRTRHFERGEQSLILRDENGRELMRFFKPSSVPPPGS